MECKSSFNEHCLNMFFDALKFARENNIKEADEVLHDIEARYMMSYISMNYAMDEILKNIPAFPNPV